MTQPTPLSDFNASSTRFQIVRRITTVFAPTDSGTPARASRRRGGKRPASRRRANRGSGLEFEYLSAGRWRCGTRRIAISVASVPLLVKRTRAADGNQLLDELAPADFEFVATRRGASISPSAPAPPHDLVGTVTEQQGSWPLK